jgi:hypothetical protein
LASIWFKTGLCVMRLLLVWRDSTLISYEAIRFFARKHKTGAPNGAPVLYQEGKRREGLSEVCESI